MKRENLFREPERSHFEIPVFPVLLQHALDAVWTVTIPRDERVGAWAERRPICIIRVVKQLSRFRDSLQNLIFFPLFFLSRASFFFDNFDERGCFFFYSRLSKAFNFKINCVSYTVVPEIKREGKFTCKRQSNFLIRYCNRRLWFQINGKDKM